jgi:hypothetical protein
MKDKRSKEEYIPLIPQLQEWLGEKGIGFFKRLKNEYGTVNAIWSEGGIPHVVHFREGIQIRNKLRDLTNNSWSCHEYDNTWVEIIEECIK